MTAARINKILFIVFILALLYSIYDLTMHVLPDFTAIIFKKGINAEKAKVISSKEGLSDINRSSSVKPLEYYTQDIDKKGLFKYSGSGAAMAQGQSMQLAPAKIKLEELVQALALKGVIEGETPQAVIEDMKSSKTYFVVKNDKIGDIIIEDIVSNKVRLRLDDQTVDLTL